MINLSIPKVGMSGQYNVSIKRGDTGLVEETGWFNNLILNSGLDMLGTGTPNAYCLAYVKVGTGTSTPVVTQTKLDSQVAEASFDGATNYINSGSPNYNGIITVKYTFPQGSVVGNITELAVGPTTTSNSDCFSRTLIVDNTGTPTTLTVQAIDQLTVFYKLTVSSPITDTLGSFVINSVTYNYTARRAQAAQLMSGNITSFQLPSFRKLDSVQAIGSDAALGDISLRLSGVSIGQPTVISHDQYTPGSYMSKSNAFFPADNSNATPIKGFNITFNSGSGYYQFLLDKTIPKASTNQLSIKFGFSWGR